MSPRLTKAHENTHPHSSPLPEGEGITLPFKGRVRPALSFAKGWGWVKRGIFE